MTVCDGTAAFIGVLQQAAEKQRQGRCMAIQHMGTVGSSTQAQTLLEPFFA